MNLKNERLVRVKKINAYVLIIIISFLVGCVKENFVEPVDPFEDQELAANPEVFTIGQGSSALKLKTNPANVLQTENGVRIKGTVFVQNSKYGDMPLSTGDFELVKNGADNFYSNITGFSKVELPHEGLLKNLQMVGLSAAKFGFKKGSEFDLGAFNWPVDSNRYYFYYENNSSPLQAVLDGSNFNLIQKIAIDPSDPFAFFQCDLSGTSLGEVISDVGFAVSVQGNIPFVPAVDIGGITGFSGNLYIEGTIPIKKYQVAFTGEACVGFNSGDPEGIKDFFTGKLQNFYVGMNGKCTLDNTVLDFLNVEVVLGTATITLKYDKGGATELKFAGLRETPSSTVSDFLYQIIGRDWNFLDYLIPYEQRETFYGTVGTVIADWQLGFKLESSLHLPGFDPIDMGKSQLELTTSHMYFFGEVVVGGLSRVGVEGYADKTGNFKLTGFAKSGFHASAGKLSIGYDLGMTVTMELHEVNGNKVFTFTGEFHFDGKACVSIGKLHLCASVHLSGSTSISSDGSYKICFSIGVGKLGFDVCISEDRNKSIASGKGMFTETMTATEIPLEQVPLENRFPAVDSETGEIVK